ncbi:hypothetical protein LFZ49_06470 [Salmonella enterica subsp. arizonae serovar 62:z36:- str. 5335/86]|nr:hypothetical protein LFZ49_06470 [Salmonella enterica subsp. arizonae serovar 62:z36:- str. 5335/86]
MLVLSLFTPGLPSCLSLTCAHAVKCYVQSDIMKREKTGGYLFTVKRPPILLSGGAEGEPSA